MIDVRIKTYKEIFDMVSKELDHLDSQEINNTTEIQKDVLRAIMISLTAQMIEIRNSK